MTVLDPEMEAWVRSATGASNIRAERRAAGASREGWAIDAERDGGGIERLWLRLDGGHGPQSNTIYTLRREAVVYRALAATSVPVPKVIAVHPTRDAFLAQRMEGRNWFRELREPAEQEAIARDFMRRLAAVHSLDPLTLDLPGFGAGRPLRELVDTEIDIWSEQASARGAPDPIVTLALSWLRRNDPRRGDEDDRIALVQGDTGPGNFLFADGRVVAILDWELAHLGDPLDDLAWICVRDLQERFTDLRARFTEYSEIIGTPIDAERLRYFRVLAQARCAIGTLNGLRARDASAEIANHLVYSTLHLRVLAEALRERIGVDVRVDATPGEGPSMNSWLYDVALEELRDNIVPGTSTEFAARRAKGTARILKYLREVDRCGRWAVEGELADLHRIRGAGSSTLEDARADLSRAIEAGSVPDDVAVAYAVRRMARETHVLRPAMGALADRDYSPIPGDPS